MQPASTHVGRIYPRLVGMRVQKGHLYSGGPCSQRRGWPPHQNPGDRDSPVGRPAAGACATRAQGSEGGRVPGCRPPPGRPHRGRPGSQRPRTGRSRQLVVSRLCACIAGSPNGGRPGADARPVVHGCTAVGVFHWGRDLAFHDVPVEAGAHVLRVSLATAFTTAAASGGTFCCGSSDASLARASASSFPWQSSVPVPVAGGPARLRSPSPLGTARRPRRSPIAEPSGRPAAEPTTTGSRYRPGRGHWGPMQASRISSSRAARRDTISAAPQLEHTDPAGTRRACSDPSARYMAALPPPLVVPLSNELSDQMATVGVGSVSRCRSAAARLTTSGSDLLTGELMSVAMVMPSGTSHDGRVTITHSSKAAAPTPTSSVAPAPTNLHPFVALMSRRTTVSAAARTSTDPRPQLTGLRTSTDLLLLPLD